MKYYDKQCIDPRPGDRIKIIHHRGEFHKVVAAVEDFTDSDGQNLYVYFADGTNWKQREDGGHIEYE